MLTAELKSQINRLWDRFWSGGIANPLTAIEQISYLIFMKRLEDMDDQRAKAASLRGQPYQSVYTQNGKDDSDCRWSRWRHMAGEEMFQHVRDKVFPFLKTIKGPDSLFGQYMKDAVFLIPKPSLLQEAVEIIEQLKIQEQNQDTQGDLYEYLLSELKTAGKNGQFRTPRHIIRMMVKLVHPKVGQRICDPACGTGGFLIGAYQHILESNTSKEIIEYDGEGTPHNLVGDRITDKEHWNFLWNQTFYGYDFDSTMVRIGLMNMILHGIEHPNLQLQDTLSKDYKEEEVYDVVLSNPPFTGSINKNEMSNRFHISTTKTELLFVELMHQLLVTGGRCAVIVPEGVLFGSSRAHKKLRQLLVDQNQLEGIISMPSGVFKPYAGVSTAVLVFTKGGKTDKVWFYDMEADGFSLDDKRQKVQENDIPDIIAKWDSRDKAKEPEKGEKWLWVSAEKIKENDYSLSISAYKPIEYEEVQYEDPKAIMDRVLKLEDEIAKDVKEIRGMMR